MSELFVKATKEKYRFDTVRGYVTTEDLWDIPLTSTQQGVDFSLNKVAQDLSKELKALGEENFVSKKDVKNTVLENKLEIVKFIIAYKLDILKRQEELANKKLIREKARRILAEREDEKFAELSDKELKKLAK